MKLMSFGFKWHELWDNLKVYGGIAFLCISSGYIMHDSYKQTYELNYKARHTVSQTVEKYRSGHLVKKIRYKYSVNDIELEGNENHHGGEIGRRHYTKFSSETPKYSDFLHDKPVPDSIKAVPPNGWEETPENVVENTSR